MNTKDREERAARVEPVARLAPRWRGWTGRTVALLKDESGASTLEYLVVTIVTIPFIIILFHPDNGLYEVARQQFDLTSTLLRLPGP